MKKKAKTKRGKHFKHEETPLPANALADDARYDLETLTRAHEIRGNEKRMGAAQAHAKRQVSLLSSVVKGGGPRDEAEMRNYAQKRKKIT